MMRSKGRGSAAGCARMHWIKREAESVLRRAGWSKTQALIEVANLARNGLLTAVSRGHTDKGRRYGAQ